MTLKNLTFYGTPWVSYSGMGFGLSQSQREENWKSIPKVDILITHGPPLGHGDATRNGNLLGCEYLLQAVKSLKPKLHVYGHIHESAGLRSDGETLFANAAVFSDFTVMESTIFNTPIVIDLSQKEFT